MRKKLTFKTDWKLLETKLTHVRGGAYDGYTPEAGAWPSGSSKSELHFTCSEPTKS